MEYTLLDAFSFKHFGHLSAFLSTDRDGFTHYTSNPFAVLQALTRQAEPTSVQVFQVVAAVQSAVGRIWPGATAEKFGSQATFMSMPGSDVDIVILQGGRSEG